MGNFGLTDFILLVAFDLLIISLFAIILIKRKSIFKETENKGLIFIRDFIQDIKISFKNPLFSILTPVLIILITFFSLSVFIGLPGTSANLNFETLLIMILLSVITAPIAEEIIQCGLLSSFYITEKYYLKEHSLSETNLRIYGFLIPVTVIIAILFALAHENGYITSFYIRTLCFIIYGLLYIFNDRNIVLPIIAHSTWNLLVIVDSVMN